ncbi:MAG: NAD(P)/FAD-dependent oxidoreductase [Promethearchaeota archaeon]
MPDSKPLFDILIVGTGPGGTIAAKTAAENGYSTCIIDKEKIGSNGRYKACGGAVAWKLIEDINYPQEKIARIIETLELHHIDGEHYSKKGKGAVVWRSIFDKHLLDIASDNGAIVKENEQLVQLKRKEGKFDIITKNSRFQAKYLIAADGAASTTLKLLSWPYFKPSDLILTITHEMKSSKFLINDNLGKESVHLFWGKNLIPVGYAWLFPKEDTITVGWGNQINLIKNSREEFNKFLSLSFVRKALSKSHKTIYKPHLIPVGLRPKLYESNVFAVGDAGGLVDPISGKGIPYAMMSGKIALESIITCENKGKLTEIGNTYRQNLSKKFLKVLKLKREMRDRIFKSDENLKNFLSLWQKYRSSEILIKGLI